VGEFNCIDVPVISLDEYIIREKISKINLIKIDVEGWELFVLKGATNLLSSDDAPVLMIDLLKQIHFQQGIIVVNCLIM
jgi:FkbM family methyltransferase